MNLHKATVEAGVRRALLARGAKAEQICDTYDFVKAGIVDSLSLLRFVLSLEDSFRIRLTDMEIVTPEFRTYGGLCRLIVSKLDAIYGQGSGS